MIQRFDVQNRNQNILKSYLLEASAGTGKTFAIENILVRLLISNISITINQILVVTFTRSATRDLKKRIHANIERTISHLKGSHSHAPDYLLSLIEQGEDAIDLARRNLEHALYNFDQAQIFTIHGFCSKMLRDHLVEGNLAIGTAGKKTQLDDICILKAIRDYFRTELHSHSYSKQQLNIILNQYGHSTDKLEQDLLSVIKKGMDIEPIPDFSTHLEEFKKVMPLVKEESKCTSSNILKDFLLQAPSYNKLCDRSRIVKPEHLEKVKRFAAFFDKTDWNGEDLDLLIADQLFIVEALDPCHLKSNAKPFDEQLHAPHLISLLKNKLEPLIKAAGHPMMIFSRLAYGCKKLVEEQLKIEEKLSYDALLQAMACAIENPNFAEKIQHSYKAVIIDEFQDTDPFQWKIFNTLFMDRNSFDGHLYLVGDPKQSIYAFRQADIYTYLSASDALGSSHHASLDTNYRSQPSLVSALNALFNEKTSPGLFSLPRSGKILEYPLVKSSKNIPEIAFSDALGSIHFCLAKNSNEERNFNIEQAEESYFFPFFVDEIQRLHNLDHIHYRQCAILVSDRFQAQRLAMYLKESGVPALTQRSKSLSESSALPALYEILNATINFRRPSIVKLGLGGRIINLTDEEIKAFDDPAAYEMVLAQFQRLRECLYKKGFSIYFEELMRSSWNKPINSVEEALLSRKDGMEFYEDIQQLAHLLLEEENHNQLSPDALLLFLDQLAELDTTDDERLKRCSAVNQDAVNILTLHASKGLEFDVVFALGLIKRSKSPSELIPLPTKNGFLKLTPITDTKSSPYEKYCQEIDAEKIRQLYVAMTRAKQRLYAPVLLNPYGKEPDSGCASPMELFLMHLHKESEPPFSQNPEKSLIELIENENKPRELTYSFLKEQTMTLREVKKAPYYELLEPPSITVPMNNLQMLSFTSLSVHKSLRTLEDVPRDYFWNCKSPHCLPANSHTGNILHTILENISFNSVYESTNPKQLISAIKPYVQGTLLAEWEEVISEIVFHALRTPLPIAEDFCIGSLSENQKYQEIEFLYPNHGLPFLEELECGPGYLKGFIDLVFIHQNKYYIVDWKSNWLGSSRMDYNQENMQKVVEANDYFLQAEIYSAALERYLKIVDPRPFHEIFGGVFYLFLRGLNAYESTNHGIFTIRKLQ